MFSRSESINVGKDMIQLYLRVKNTPDTEKHYLRFRNFLQEELDYDYITGSGDRTVIGGKGYIVNVVRSKDYFHIIIVCKRELRDKMREGLKFF